MAEITQYLKPQSPLQMSTNGIYPLTTADQIINEDGTRVNNVIDKEEVLYLYKITFAVASWSGSGPYNQTASFVKIDNGPDISSNSIIQPAGIDNSLSEEVKKELRVAAQIVFNANRTIGNNTMTISVTSKPTMDAEVYFWSKKGE